jgi:O-antigen ligase
MLMRIQKPLERCAQNLLASRIKSSFIGVFGAVTTFAIAPNNGDVYNFPKLMALIAFAIFSLLILLTSRSELIYLKTLLGVIGAFVLSLFLVLLFSGAKISDQLWGAFGRNTGLIAYLCLALILIASASLSSSDVVLKTFQFFIAVGSISTLYAIAQRFNLNPFPTFTIYRPVVSFFGNPNFQAAFSAMTLICAVGLFFAKDSSKFLRVFLIVYVEATIFVIFETQSLQGIVVSIIGILVFLGIRIFTDSEFFGFRISYSIFVSFLSIISLAGTLNHGPLSRFLYKESVEARGDFWRAGIKMAFDHPVFGVGLDNYGNFYMQSRDSKTINRDASGMADAAHNVFIDFAANGGVILFATYTALILYTLICAGKALQNSKSFDPLLATLIAVWIGYIAQSVISINQLGVAVWGWIFAGLVIGYTKKSVKA